MHNSHMAYFLVSVKTNNFWFVEH